MFVKNSYFFISLVIALIFLNINQNKFNEDTYAILKIPAIKLEEKIYHKNSKFNNLNYGLYFLPESTDIEDEEANLIIASHSGNSKISYFKDLENLQINDEIKIVYKKEIYIFRIINIYLEKKDGLININRYNTKTLSLVTCKKNTPDLHYVISAIYNGKLEKNA